MGQVGPESESRKVGGVALEQGKAVGQRERRGSV